MDDEEIKNKIFKTQQYVIDMTKKKKYYEEIMNKNSNLINDLNIKNEKLEKEVFTSKLFSLYLFIFKCIYIYLDNKLIY